MTEPLYGDAVVVRVEAAPDGTGGVIDVVGTAAGPAGVSEVEFADGTVWEVDHARPGQLVQLTVNAEQLTDSRVAAALIGSERVEAIARWVRSQSAARRPLRLDGDSPSGRNRFGSYQRGSDAVRAGWLVLAADLVDDPTVEPLVRIAAGLEWLTELDEDETFEMFAPLRGAMAETLTVLAADVDDVMLIELTSRDGDAARHLERLLERADPTEDGARDALRRLAWRLAAQLGQVEDTWTAAVRLAEFREDDDFGFAADRSASAPASRVYSPPPERRRQVDFDPDFRRVTMDAPGVLRIEVARGEPGRWVRVLRRDGLVTIALAPLQRDRLLDVAVLAVPPDVDVDALVIEVVSADRIDAAPRGAEVIRDAIRAGRTAAHFERLGLAAPAHDQWLRCSELWADAGDPTRAKLARLYARDAGHRFPSSSGEPLLADTISQALARS